MQRWTTILGALLIVLMLWTGSSAHASERVDCIPVAAESAGHFDGDKDEAPSKQDQGVGHHHSGCSGHHAAASSATKNIEIAVSKGTEPFAWRDAGRPGRGPDGRLRPPIA